MKQQKFLIISIVVLLFLNVGTLSFLFLNMQKPPLPPLSAESVRRPGPETKPPSISLKLQEPLSLDETQVKKIDSIHLSHVKKMRQIDEDFKNTMGNYFSLLSKESYSEREKDSLQKELIRIHTSKIEASFSNFEHIKMMLTQEQQKIFSRMIPEMTGRMIEHRAAPKPPARPIPH